MHAKLINFISFDLIAHLSRYRKKIEEAAKKDTKFFQLLKHGIKVNFQLNGPTFDLNDIKHKY